MIEFSYVPDWRWLAGAGLAGFLVLLLSYYFSVGRPGWGLRGGLLGLRWLAMAAVVICLLNPQRVDEERRQQGARMAVLLDTSQSMSVRDVPGNRLEQAKRWLHEGLLPAWDPNLQREIHTFDSTVKPLANFDSASPTGRVTSLAEALETVLASAGDTPLAGVVVCSDGIDTSQRDLTAVAKSYRRKRIPIHTATMGTTRDMRDIVLENVQVKRAVPNQAPTRIGVRFRAPGFAHETAPVEIRQDGTVIARREVKFTGGNQSIELDFTPRQKGFQTYEVHVPAQPGEWLTSNNRRLFGLEVVDPTIHVLYMEGTPHLSSAPIPEWKYLKDALESDPNIKVKVLYQPYSGSGNSFTVDADPQSGEKVYPVNHSTRGFPRTMADLLHFDVIIHSDIKIQYFKEDQLQNLARFVEQHGGGFVMVGGNSAFGRGGYQKTVIDRITPVAMQQFADSSRATFKMRVPAGAYDHPIMALGATREETMRIWTDKLPELRGLNRVDHSKPGAVVLAETPAGVSGSGGQDFGRRVVLAVQEIGQGRSMAFTSDTTRTWGEDFETLWGERINPAQRLSEANCDARYYRTFWINAIRWLAAGKVGKTNNPVTLELTQSYTLPHQPVRAAVKVRDAALNDLAGADVTLVLSAGTNQVASAKAAFDPASRTYVAQVQPETMANYLVTASAQLKGQKLGEDQQLLICEAADPEMTDVRSKPDMMAELARISGGQVLAASERNARALAGLFHNAAPVTVNYRRTPLWDNAWLLGGVLGLLTLEWVLRRVRGLA